jgi:hypothetical protein
MKMKKLVIASAITLMGATSAYAQVTPLEVELGALLTSIGTSAGSTDGPDIAAISGAVNTAALNGSIDISGANVSLSSMAADVSAKAEAIGENSTATAYAIAGAKLSTTVIGAMNSATVDVMAKTTDLTASVNTTLGVGMLAADSGVTMVGQDVAGAGTLTGSLTGNQLLNATGSINLENLASSVSLTGSSMVEELQAMNVFNTAINVAALDASIVITAAVDPNAWFLNPQTGVVNLSNIEMSTTNIGAMNSSLTRLGVKF